MKEKRIRETILQKTESADHTAPTPALVTNFANVDLQHIAGLRALDKNRASQRMNQTAIDIEEFRQSHGGMNLRTATVDALEVHGIAGGDTQSGRKIAVPTRVRGLRGEMVFGHGPSDLRNDLQLDQGVAR